MRLLTGSIGAGALILLLAGATRELVPTAFRFDVTARPELRRLWQTSVSAKAERVACLAGSIDSDTVLISEVFPLDAPADSMGVSATASLQRCGPPRWRGTVHTHVALRDGRLPYSLFSGADRGIMMLWLKRWKEDGIFCLLYSAEEVICEIEGPRGAVLFPRSRY
jgi:hypothetical protein